MVYYWLYFELHIYGGIKICTVVRVSVGLNPALTVDTEYNVLVISGYCSNTSQILPNNSTTDV